MKVTINNKFLAGAITAQAVQSLWEDSLGMEKCIAHMADHWVSWKYSVPYAIFCLLLAVILCFKKDD